jgi:hypothetical protein
MFRFIKKDGIPTYNSGVTPFGQKNHRGEFACNAIYKNEQDITCELLGTFATELEANTRGEQCKKEHPETTIMIDEVHNWAPSFEDLLDSHKELMTQMNHMKESIWNHYESKKSII